MPPQHRRLVYLWHYRAVSPKALCFSDFLFVGGTGGVEELVQISH